MFFKLPTEVYIENNAVKNHRNKFNSFGKKCMIVTGFNSSRINGSLDDIIDSLNELGIDYILFNQIEENPLTTTIIKAAHIGINEKVEFLIGVGGGSSIDASKAISVLIKNNTLNEEFLYSDTKAEALPIVAIPTTCGTGSEVTGVSVLSVPSKGTKIAISHKIFPNIALLDYKYLKTLPTHIIRNTSIDALAHLYESYINSNATIISRCIVIEGLKFWSKCKNSLINGNFSDEDYLNLLLSSMIAGMAIAHTGTSLAHGLSYLITYETKIPHGKAVGYYLKEFVEKSNEYDEILEASSFNDINELDCFLHNVLGEIDISEELLKRSVMDLFNNKGKLKSCPYEVDLDVLNKISKL